MGQGGLPKSDMVSRTLVCMGKWEHTFEMDGGVGVLVISSGNRLLNALFVVVALYLVAIFVDQRWVLIDDCASKASVFSDLSA
jgi:hypothetical protein